MSLWLVEIDEDDWDYDRFQSAVVEAPSPEEAEAMVRTEWRSPPPDRFADRWIENPEWRLNVRPVPKPDGRVLLVHWHAG